ncbi:hypothetical protein [Mucilaginibacter sp.]|uniref:hypothetical protein n=1 Tax=Mucilaginibacter sp. TaxID=1882438 RepID=UPI0035BC9376
MHVRKHDNIKEIRIDKLERLCVMPDEQNFSFIWRSAMEVHWDEKGKFLYSPKPREWSYFDWYRQILDATKDEYGCCLVLTNETSWIDIPIALKEQILSYVHS